MAQGNDNRNDVVYSQSPTEESTNSHMQRLATGTLTWLPLELPTLSMDLIAEFLCRLPVKLLIQLRCVCKFFNSLISDPNFAKKHLHMSTKRHHLMVTSENNLGECVHHDSPIPSVFSTSIVVTQTQFYLPNGHNYLNVLCCCDGMFCGEINVGSYFLWNPSIRKFKLLPPLDYPLEHVPFYVSFGYDHFIDRYKVISVSSKNGVFVYTLGTDYWTRIQDIPFDYRIYEMGVFVSGTVNWFAWDVIISLDLEKESYQKLCLPEIRYQNGWWTLGVVRDCLCVFASSDRYLDVWIMKEYGNKESWTILYIIPDDRDLLAIQDLVANIALYFSEDDQLLVECCEQQTCNMKLVVYDSETCTLNIPEFQNIYEYLNAQVYIESLISP